MERVLFLTFIDLYFNDHVFNTNDHILYFCSEYFQIYSYLFSPGQVLWLYPGGTTDGFQAEDFCCWILDPSCLFPDPCADFWPVLWSTQTSLWSRTKVGSDRQTTVFIKSTGLDVKKSISTARSIKQPSRFKPQLWKRRLVCRPRTFLGRVFLCGG